MNIFIIRQEKRKEKKVAVSGPVKVNAYQYRKKRTMFTRQQQKALPSGARGIIFLVVSSPPVPTVALTASYTPSGSQSPLTPMILGASYKPTCYSTPTYPRISLWHSEPPTSETSILSVSLGASYTRPGAFAVEVRAWERSLPDGKLERTSGLQRR